MDKLQYQKLLALRRSEEELFYTLLKVTRMHPRDLINKLSINRKRAWYILSKWCAKGYYEYGISLDLGWLTDKPFVK